MTGESTARQVVETTIVAFVAFVVGSHFTHVFHGASSAIGGLWTVITGLLVLQSSRSETLSSAWLQLLGALIGAIISAAYLLIFPFSAVGMAVCIGFAVLLCQMLSVPSYGRLAGITVAVVLVVSSRFPTMNPLLNALLRFVKAAIGATLAVAVAYLRPRS